MSDQNQKRFATPKTIIIGATAILALGTVTAWFAYNSLEKQVNQNPDDKKTIVTPDIPQGEETKEVGIYLLDDDLAMVSLPQKLPFTDNEEELVKGALHRLLNNPDTQFSTAIPDNTELLSLEIREEGIYLDLSAEFTEGGGSASMIARLGQIVYTATSDNPDSLLWLSVEGKPLETLGGEGLLVDQPITRELYSLSFPQN
ncbi:MAG: GerMN domain-containing protein [Cyanobacterium sp. T60_A2020_053]|nr:GerMN domain-containing protein [Cyanobacterium sp. T60_A2020_053]